MQVLEQVDSWKEMIQTTSVPLLSRGVIQNSYIQGIIHLVDGHGPYILPASPIAVAHAKLEHKTFRLGLSLLVCHEGVYLDKVSAVWYLPILSDAVHDKHLNVPHEILQLSRNSTLLTQLDVCTSIVEVHRALLHAFP